MPKKTIKAALKIIGIVIIAILLFAFFYLKSSSGQKFVSTKAIAELNSLLKTPVSGDITYSFPNWIKVENLLIKDKKLDTLIYANQSYMGFDMLALIGNQLNINDIEFHNGYLNIYSEYGKYNYEPILDAFSSDTTKASKPMKMKLKNILLEKIKFRFKNDAGTQNYLVNINKGTTGFSVLNPDKSIYYLSKTEIDGLKVTGILSEEKNNTGKVEAETISTTDFSFGNIDLKNADVNITQKTANKNIVVNNLALKLNPKEFNLIKNIYDFENLATSADKVVYKTIDAKSNANEFDVNNIELAKVSMAISDIVSTKKGQSLKILSAKATERSGINITQLSTNISVANNKLVADKLEIKTAKSDLKAKVNANLNNNIDYIFDVISSKIAIAEALYFSKNLAKNPYYQNLKNDNFLANGSVNGNFKNLNISKLNLIAPLNTSLKLTGSILNFDKPKLNLTIQNFITYKKDLFRILPKNQIPTSVDLPNKVVLNGKITGDLNNLNLKLNTVSDAGIANFTGNLKNFSSKAVPKYSGKIVLNNFNAGKVLKNPDLSKISTDINFDGQGLDSKSMQITLKGGFKQVIYAGKTYQNITIDGKLKNQIFDTKLAINDPAAKVNWEGKIDLKNPNIEIDGKTNLDFVNLKTLGLTDQNIQLKGDFDINKLKIDPKNPWIDLKGNNVILTKDNKNYKLGDVILTTSGLAKTKNVFIKTEFMNATATGNFDYDKLKDIVMTELNKYFKIPDYKPVTSLGEYSFNLVGNVKYDSLFTSISTSIKAFKTISFNSNLQSDNITPIYGQISIPYLMYDSIKVSSVNFNFKGDGKVLSYDGLSQEITNESFRVRDANLVGTVQNSIANFNLAVKDTVGVRIHALSGFVQNIDDNFRLSFDESGSMLFYEEWSGNPYGYIDFTKNGVLVNDVVFTSKNQIVRVMNLDGKPNGPLKMFTENINLNYLAKAFLQDSTLASGSLDANIELRNYMGDAPTFLGDFKISNLALKQVEMGTFSGNAASAANNSIHIESLLKGEKTDLNLTGYYYPNKENALDLRTKINRIDPKLIEAYSSGILEKIEGNVTGNYTIKGSAANPEIEGVADFDKFAFVLVQTGSKLSLDGQKLILKDKKVNFNNFAVQDIDQNKMLVNGDLNITNLPNYSYNLKLSTHNFKLMDAEKGQNDMFFGQGYFDSNLDLIGKNLNFKLTGTVNVDSKTDLTMLLPDNAAQTTELQSMVQFVNFNKPNLILRKPFKEQSRLSLANAVNIGLEINENAQLKVLMDQVTGDLMTVSGNGKLTIGFDNLGDLSILGRYDIVKGKYNMTYQVIKREFIINQNSGSNIVWTGSPMGAAINITAENYMGRKSFKNYGNAKYFSDSAAVKKLTIPLTVDLVLSGVLSNPEVNFEMAIYEADLTASMISDFKNFGFRIIDSRGVTNTDSKNDVSVKENIKQQAIMMLALGTFSGSDLNDKLDNITGTSENMARQKVSDLISSQLNRYTQGIIKGIDIDLGVQSGFNAGNASRNTNLNFGLSKKLANNRLIISVGKNFELENKDLKSDEIFDNIRANWLITKDGRYRVNLYRSGNFQTEGYVIVTGLGLAVAIDYDSWKEIIKSKK